MKEETELHVALGVADFFAKHSRKKHEMVIVYPNQIIVLDVLCDFFCEQTVGLAVGVPGRLVESNLTGVVVEEGPED